MRLVDSHCHLASETFAGDLPEVVARAESAGVTHALVVLEASDTVELGRAREIALQWNGVRFAAGVHPHCAGRYAGNAAAAAEATRAVLTRVPNVCAVGEIGLDYHYDFAPRDVQQDTFRHQLRLAREMDRPVVIHTREADEDTFSILAQEGHRGLRGVFHCFTGDRVRAERALALGFHVSFAGIVTFPRAEDLREAARIVPSDRLLVETDAPYLAPVPHRGKRNEPAWVAHVVETLGRVRGEPSAAVAAAASRTFDLLFQP